jgi:hypothetical protein
MTTFEWVVVIELGAIAVAQALPLLGRLLR